jgi:hypothetical protein
LLPPHLCPPGLPEEAEDGGDEGEDDDGGVAEAEFIAEEGDDHQLRANVDDEPSRDQVAVCLSGDVVLEPVEEVADDIIP